ncbi:MAG TPA: undecaprenyl-phosphate glucose phosphotransferase [Polyangiaceae bacterium]|nr:undecaprenyl-phosphate glucose phosphotransferase [Polyangiaceae bacterium]
MLKRYQCTFGYALMVCDACVVVGAWFAAYWLRFWFPFHVPAPLELTPGLPSFASYAGVFPLVVVVWVTVLLSMRVYEGGRMLGRASQFLRVVKAHFTALLLFVAFSFFVKEWRYSRVAIVYFGVLGAMALIGTRLLARATIHALRSRGRRLRNVLAIGDGLAFKALLERLERFPELGLQVVGTVSAHDSIPPSSGSHRFLGHYGEISKILNDTKVDEVLIALPPERGQELDRILDLLKDETLDICVVPDLHQYVTLGCDVEDFDGLPLVRLNDSPVIGWGALAKRTTDIIASAAALIVLSPLLGLIALGIRLTSAGPVLYAQERMGLDGRSFRMLKFRSMRIDAEHESGAVWARADDDRRTAFGTLLRKTSLDELPQFWNVLCGDMSLVGPRPERPVFVQKFRDQIPHYMLRHKVRAGITGWAQVNGWRGNTSLDRRIECDLFYIRHWSYVLDLKILTMTLWKGFVDKNAY